MNALLLYMAKTAVYIAGFYTVYFLFLSKDTYYFRNRVFLLSSLVLSFVLPLVTIPVRQENSIFYFGRSLSEVIVTAERVSGVAETDKVESASLMITILRIYIIGVIVFGIKLLADILSLIVMITRKKADSIRLIRFKGFNTAGFSAMGYIFINHSLPPAEEEEIIRHEQNHLEHNHFFDILLLEIVKIFQWFNPVIYMMNRSLRAVHEYQADAGCLKSGMTVARYQTLLLTHLLRSKIILTSNSFSNPSLIRKRMTMMSKAPSGVTANLKLLLSIPVACIILIVLSAFEINRDSIYKSQPYETISSSANVTLDISGPIVYHKPVNPGIEVESAPSPPPAPVSQESKKDEASTLSDNSEKQAVPEEIFVVVEEMPQYPGGDKALMEFIYANIIYPPAAKEKNIEGRVILRFAVMADGKVDKIQVIRGIDPDLDQEAKRVVAMMETWKPGKQEGRPVNVWYSVPITFQLK